MSTQMILIPKKLKKNKTLQIIIFFNKSRGVRRGLWNNLMCRDTG